MDTPDINAWKSALQIASLSVSVTIVLFSKKCSVEDFARISEFKNVHLVSTEHGIHRAVKLISSFITPPHSNSDLIFRTVPSP
ncbi:MAG: hypothetical protein JKX97_03575 [Candidatus Lindowbacteria bacterium]|nr:hypothetical protein [Candidatus Lindowbacteria bacterium]